MGEERVGKSRARGVGGELGCRKAELIPRVKTGLAGSRAPDVEDVTPHHLGPGQRLNLDSWNQCALLGEVLEREPTSAGLQKFPCRAPSLEGLWEQEGEWEILELS